MIIYFALKLFPTIKLSLLIPNFFLSVNVRSPILYLLPNVRLITKKPMSTYKKLITLRKEIERLNDIIDAKIVRGRSYREESRRHKFLTSQKRALSQASFFSKTFNLVSTFLF